MPPDPHSSNDAPVFVGIDVHKIFTMGADAQDGAYRKITEKRVNLTPDCLACFLKQALRVARLAAPDDRGLHVAVVQDWAAAIAGLDEEGLTQPPTALAARLYPRAYAMAGVEDPYAEAKARANSRVLDMLPQLEAVVRGAQDPLRAALNLSIHGNFIDLGVPGAFDWEAALDLDEAQRWSTPAHARFAAAVEKQPRVLILGDNAGEIAMDTLLVRVLVERGCAVVYAVRGGPIINDATRADATAVGMERFCTVVDTGATAPGVLLDRVGEEFRTAFAAAELVLSKGQGNFESLHGQAPGAFYAFKAKCEVVSRLLGMELGDSVFVCDA